jgi:resuscitation-promoting factor RpfA
MISPLIALSLSLAPMGSGSVWDRLAECESGGNWSLDSTFDGGLQFAPSVWTNMGGPTPYAYQATRSQQIAVAQRLWEIQGWGAWPGCARALGLYGTDPTQDSSRVDAQTDAPEIEPGQPSLMALAVEGSVCDTPGRVVLDGPDFACWLIADALPVTE